MTTLLYIVGLSRSGSTLLELAMAAHDSVETVGELQVWPHEITEPGGVLPCGCGRAVPECEFWTGVRERVDPLRQPPPRLDHFRETHQWGYTNRPGIFAQFGRAPLSSDRRLEVERYGENTAEIVEAAADQYMAMSGERPRVIVDASKDPYRALWLARSDRVDLRVVHLIRDPRGAVHSLTKHCVDRRERIVMAARRALAWDVENLLAQKVLSNHVHSDHGLSVHYEDLVDDPVAVLSRVAEMCGAKADPGAPERAASVAVHSVAGNPMRQQRRPISHDLSWQTDMDPSVRSMVSVMTRPTRWWLDAHAVPGSRG